MKTVIILALSCLSCINIASAQSYTKGYQLDKTLKGKQDTESLMGAILQTEWISDGKKLDFPLSGEKPFYAIASADSVAHSRPDGVIVIALLSGFTGDGIQIEIHPDSVHIIHVLATKDASKEFRYYTTDKEYTEGLGVPAKSYTLKLAAIPQPGEPIEGYVEYESREFFHRTSNGDVSRQYKLKGYFYATYLGK